MRSSWISACSVVGASVGQQIASFARHPDGESRPAAFDAPAPYLLDPHLALAKASLDATDLTDLAHRLDEALVRHVHENLNHTALSLVTLCYTTTLFADLEGLTRLDVIEPGLGRIVRQVRPVLAEQRPPPAGWAGTARVGDVEVNVVEELAAMARLRGEPADTVEEIRDEAHRRAGRGRLLPPDGEVRSLGAYLSYLYPFLRATAIRTKARRPLPIVEVDAGWDAHHDIEPSGTGRVLRTLELWFARAAATPQKDVRSLVADREILDLLVDDDDARRVMAYLEGVACCLHELPGVAHLSAKSRRGGRVYPVAAGIALVGLARQAGLVAGDADDLVEALTLCVGKDLANGARRHRVRSWSPGAASLLDVIF